MCAGICSIAAFAIGTVCPEPIVGVYIDRAADAGLFERGVEALRIYSVAFLPLGTVITLMGYFTSIEIPKFAMSISIGRGLVFVSVFLIILSAMFGEKGVWLSASASEICALFLALILYRRQRRSA